MRCPPRVRTEDGAFDGCTGDVQGKGGRAIAHIRASHVLVQYLCAHRLIGWTLGHLVMASMRPPASCVKLFNRYYDWQCHTTRQTRSTGWMLPPTFRTRAMPMTSSVWHVRDAQAPTAS